VLAGYVAAGDSTLLLLGVDPFAERQFRDFLSHMPDDELYKYVDLLYKVVPPILKEQGKAKNPWPNVDAQSGVVQWHYGVTQYDFYTVLFSIGRALGVLANIVWDRALGYPIERPKSITTDMLEQMVGVK
jgi:citrate synthase